MAINVGFVPGLVFVGLSGSAAMSASPVMAGAAIVLAVVYSGDLCAVGLMVPARRLGGRFREKLHTLAKRVRTY